MAQDEFRDVNLIIEIKNFPANRKAKCPYCGKRPEKVEWSHEGLRIWCRNQYCSGNGYKIFVPIYPEELDLVAKTKNLLADWGQYCAGIKART